MTPKVRARCGCVLGSSPALHFDYSDHREQYEAAAPVGSSAPEEQNQLIAADDPELVELCAAMGVTPDGNSAIASLQAVVKAARQRPRPPPPALLPNERRPSPRSVEQAAAAAAPTRRRRRRRPLDPSRQRVRASRSQGLAMGRSRASRRVVRRSMRRRACCACSTCASFAGCRTR